MHPDRPEILMRLDPDEIDLVPEYGFAGLLLAGRDIDFSRYILINAMVGQCRLMGYHSAFNNTAADDELIPYIDPAVFAFFDPGDQLIVGHGLQIVLNTGR